MKLDKEALFYDKEAGNGVRCRLCPHRCRIPDGKAGLCRVRINREGTLYSAVYGRCAALHVDPIEKKPLFHFLPGADALSIATVGCNLRCVFCQNADISQFDVPAYGVPGEKIGPGEIVEIAERERCQIISYTYTEPTVFFEYALDTAELAAAKGIRNTFVSNGFISSEALHLIEPVLDGINLDLKSFSDAFYREHLGARLAPVLETLRTLAGSRVWLEVTTLLIPGLNDSEAEVRKIAAFIASLSPDIPWHVSRFYPRHRLTDRPPTSVGTIARAREIGLEAGLKHVYCGNVPGEEGESTSCPGCGRTLIRRVGYGILRNALENGACPGCGEKISGVWE